MHIKVTFTCASLCCIDDAIRRPGPSDVVSWPIDSDSDDDADLVRGADAAEQRAAESPIRATTTSAPVASTSGTADGRPVSDVATGSGTPITTIGEAAKLYRDLAKLISSNRSLGSDVEIPVTEKQRPADVGAAGSAKDAASKKSHHKQVTNKSKEAATSTDESGAAKRKRGRPVKVTQLPRIFQSERTRTCETERGRTDFDNNGFDSDINCNESGHGSTISRPLVIHDENAVADVADVSRFYGAN